LGVDFLVVQYRRKSNYETANLDDEWIILNTDQYTITKLNETGGYCWGLLSNIQTLESLCEAVVQKYDQGCEGVKEDMDRFLLELLECGLIENVV
jgi:formylmethanofuran dehydrogenase subunit A